MVVRFEVDAYVAPPSPPQVSRKTHSSRSAAKATQQQSRSESRRLAGKGSNARPRTTNAPSGVSSPSQNQSQSLAHSLVRVVDGGTLVPQSSLLELKTCSLNKMTLKKSKAFPQLFFSRTPYLYIGGHVDGRFSEILQTDVSAGDLQRQHDALVTSGALKRLVVALRRIQEVVRKSGKEGRLTLIFEGKALKVYQRDVGAKGMEGMMPGEMLARFES